MENTKDKGVKIKKIPLKRQFSFFQMFLFEIVLCHLVKRFFSALLCYIEPICQK